ncbi:hypothetical protein D3C78_1531620 [compost metagenome]
MVYHILEYQLTRKLKDKLIKKKLLEQVEGNVHMAISQEEFNNMEPEEAALYCINHNGIVAKKEKFYILNIHDLEHLNELLKEFKLNITFEADSDFYDYNDKTLYTVWFEEYE